MRVFTREFFIPKDPSKVIDKPELDSIVFYVDGLYPVALGFSGRRNKPDFNRRFKSLDDRERYTERYFERLTQIRLTKIRWKAEKKQAHAKFLAALKPGVILCDTWGWEQTQVEFYKVLEVKGSKVKIVELSQIRDGEPTSWASDRVIPGAECGKPEWKTARGAGIKINSSVYLTIWDGCET